MTNRPMPRKIHPKRFTAPFQEYRVKITREQYIAVKMSAMGMRGFKYPFERDLDSEELIVYGRDDKGIRAALEDFCPGTPITAQFSYMKKYDV